MVSPPLKNVILVGVGCPLDSTVRNVLLNLFLRLAEIWDHQF